MKVCNNREDQGLFVMSYHHSSSHGPTAMSCLLNVYVYKEQDRIMTTMTSTSSASSCGPGRDRKGGISSLAGIKEERDGVLPPTSSSSSIRHQLIDLQSQVAQCLLDVLDDDAADHVNMKEEEEKEEVVVVRQEEDRLTLKAYVHQVNDDDNVGGGGGGENRRRQQQMEEDNDDTSSYERMIDKLAQALHLQEAKKDDDDDYRTRRIRRGGHEVPTSSASSSLYDYYSRLHPHPR